MKRTQKNALAMAGLMTAATLFSAVPAHERRLHRHHARNRRRDRRFKRSVRHQSPERRYGGH